MNSFRCFCIAIAGLLLSGCWANPSLVKIHSDPPGARVLYDGQDLGVTPISTVLACRLETQHVRLELAGQSHDIPLNKRPIRYYVPWYAVVAFGVFTFTTTWRSEACLPDDFTVVMGKGEMLTDSSKAETEARAAQEEWITKTKKSEEADRTPSGVEVPK